MNRKTMVLVAAAFSLAAAPRYESPAFGVAEGAALEKSFTTELQVTMEDATVTFNGEDTDIGEMGLPEDLELIASYELVCTDTYESMGAERPLVLLRAFDTLRTRYEDQDGEGEEDEPVELEGKTVRFAWNAEEEAYDRSFAGDEGDEEDLDDLVEDLDLRALLPDGEVAEGDTWSTDGIVLLELWMPGFDVRTKLTDGDLGEAPPELAETLLGLVEELAVECTYEGTVQEGGAELGQIALATSVEVLAPVPPDFLGGDDEGPGLTWDHLDATFELQLEGTLLWNLSEARFHSIEGKSEGALELDFAFAIEDFGLEIAGTIEFSLQLEQSAEASAAG